MTPASTLTYIMQLDIWTNFLNFLFLYSAIAQFKLIWLVLFGPQNVKSKTDSVFTILSTGYNDLVKFIIRHYKGFNEAVPIDDKKGFEYVSQLSETILDELRERRKDDILLAIDHIIGGVFKRDKNKAPNTQRSDFDIVNDDQKNIIEVLHRSLCETFSDKLNIYEMYLFFVYLVRVLGSSKYNESFSSHEQLNPEEILSILIGNDNCYSNIFTNFNSLITDSQYTQGLGANIIKVIQQFSETQVTYQLLRQPETIEITVVLSFSGYEKSGFSTISFEKEVDFESVMFNQITIPDNTNAATLLWKYGQHLQSCFRLETSIWAAHVPATGLIFAAGANGISVSRTGDTEIDGNFASDTTLLSKHQKYKFSEALKLPVLNYLTTVLLIVKFYFTQVLFGCGQVIGITILGAKKFSPFDSESAKNFGNLLVIHWTYTLCLCLFLPSYLLTSYLHNLMERNFIYEDAARWYFEPREAGRGERIDRFSGNKRVNAVRLRLLPIYGFLRSSLCDTEYRYSYQLPGRLNAWTRNSVAYSCMIGAQNSVNAVESTDLNDNLAVYSESSDEYSLLHYFTTSYKAVKALVSKNIKSFM